MKALEKQTRRDRGVSCAVHPVGEDKVGGGISSRPALGLDRLGQETGADERSLKTGRDHHETNSLIAEPESRHTVEPPSLSLFRRCKRIL